MDFREKCLGCIHAPFTARYVQPGQWARSIGRGALACLTNGTPEEIVVWGVYHAMARGYKVYTGISTSGMKEVYSTHAMLQVVRAWQQS